MRKRAACVWRIALLLSTGTWAHAGSTDTRAPSGSPQPAPPLPPANVYVVPDAQNPTEVKIHWSAGSSDQSGFLVERSQSGAAFTEIASVGPGVREADDSSLYADRRYKYRVRAFKSLPNGPTLESASSLSLAYQPPIFKAFSGKFTSNSKPKFGFGPLAATADRSTRYLNHVLEGGNTYTYTTIVGDLSTTIGGYYASSTAQKWSPPYTTAGSAYYESRHADYGGESVILNSGIYEVRVSTAPDGTKQSKWVSVSTNGTAVDIDDPIALAHPYLAVEPTSLTENSAMYSSNLDATPEGEHITSYGSASETLSEKYSNVSFAQAVLENAPPLDEQPSLVVPEPWHPDHRHLASRVFYDFQGDFLFFADFCVKAIELNPCDGSDFDYILEKRTTGNGQGPPEIKYTLTSLRLSGSSTAIEPVDVTEDLTEDGADGMINQNADWSAKSASRLVAYQNSEWALDEFEKGSPGMVVGKGNAPPCSFYLIPADLSIDDVTYTLTWDAEKFEVTCDSEVLSSPYVQSSGGPLKVHFSIVAKEQENIAAQTTVHLKAETQSGAVGDDEIKVRLLPVQIEVRKKGTTKAPDDGLVVKNGDLVEFALAPQFFDVDDAFETLFTWQQRQLKGDGTYTEWTDISAQATGTKFEHAMAVSGIFQIKAVITDGGEHIYTRRKDAPHGANKDGVYNEKLRRGNPDYVGVVDNDLQLAIRNQALDALGSIAYAKAAAFSPVGYGVDPTLTFKGRSKCNIFVFRIANAAGAAVPTRIWPDKVPSFGVPPWTIVDRPVPPGANEWHGSAYSIPAWTWSGPSTLPQPGYAVMHQHVDIAIGGAAHMGILDYDGTWINAGEFTVNKSIHVSDSSYQPANYRKP